MSGGGPDYSAGGPAHSPTLARVRKPKAGERSGWANDSAAPTLRWSADWSQRDQCHQAVEFRAGGRWLDAARGGHHAASMARRRKRR